MNIVNINNKTDLLEHRGNIENLFFDSFGRRAIGDVWDWAYLENPSGEPFVSLCYEGGALVGHYAIVPMPLSSRLLHKNSYISMTTMVAESHRKFGLFTTLAQENYKIAEKAGVDFVMGFPNSQSTPGFKKRLGWDLPDPDYVAKIDKDMLVDLVKVGYFDKQDTLGLNLADARLREWRLGRPGGTYQLVGGVAYKVHQGSIDLIWWEDSDALLALPDTSEINVLVTTQSGLDQYKVFDYQFGGISLCSQFSAHLINREMAISDLF